MRYSRTAVPEFDSALLAVSNRYGPKNQMMMRKPEVMIGDDEDEEEEEEEEEKEDDDDDDDEEPLQVKAKLQPHVATIAGRMPRCQVPYPCA